MQMHIAYCNILEGVSSSLCLHGPEFKEHLANSDWEIPAVFEGTLRVNGSGNMNITLHQAY
ncbi:hypothetical protein RchiOBHm_Chr2g0116751 [Rosa chinensis]|uniref:Uncharacterized protein n=1 Tax=Rosa chinensis TaxID=74649 RepID=A0A2P6RRE3_ROSCH|nr:hypothetical protein RchiOBHm_Chr2g0116751 [Rosa chinensis]